jgi:hypothetical protein
MTRTDTTGLPRLDSLGRRIGARRWRGFTPGERARGLPRSNATNRRRAVEAYRHLAGEMLELRAEGLDYNAIARRLNARGERTRLGASWTGVQVRRALRRVGAGEGPSEATGRAGAAA